MSIDEINELFINGTITKEDLSSREVFKLVKMFLDSVIGLYEFNGKHIRFDLNGNVKYFIIDLNLGCFNFGLHFNAKTGFSYHKNVEMHVESKLIDQFLTKWTKGILSAKGN